MPPPLHGEDKIVFALGLTTWDLPSELLLGIFPWDYHLGFALRITIQDLPLGLQKVQVAIYWDMFLTCNLDFEQVTSMLFIDR